MATATAKRPSFLDPGRLYSLEGFKACSGISGTRIREARLQGLELPAFNVGRRKFIKGVEAIDYVERLAELSR